MKLRLLLAFLPLALPLVLAAPDPGLLDGLYIGVEGGVNGDFDECVFVFTVPLALRDAWDRLTEIGSMRRRRDVGCVG
jgi:hypothetical protein